MAGLYSNSLGESIGHGAMGEGAEQSALAVHVQIARGPDGGRAYVAGKHRILCRKLIEEFGYVLGVNWCAPRFTDREIIETLTGVLIVTQAGIEIRSIAFAFDQWSQQCKRILHISDQAQIDWGAAAYLLTQAVYLDDLCVFGIELLIGKVSAQHE